MNIMEARKWAFEHVPCDGYEPLSTRVAKAEAVAQWLINGEYKRPEPTDEPHYEAVSAFSDASGANTLQAWRKV